MYILRGLGVDYRSFVTSMNLRPHEPLLFELHSSLFIEEQSIFAHTRFEEEQILQTNLA